MGRRILVIDGSNLSRLVLKSYLKQELPDAHVVTAKSGKEAIAHLDNDSEFYHLVTTSLLLPDMDGLDLCRAVRANPVHKYAPVLVVSSDADTRLTRDGFDAGVTEFFDKARGVEALGEFIKEFVHRNPGRVGKILYVEDSKTAAMIGKKIMLKHGLIVIHKESAEEAVRVLEHPTSDGRPDMVVTDFFLKGEMTGLDLLGYVRSDMRLSPQEMPVLVVTGQSGEGKQAEVLMRGANDFIEKPIIEEIMMARIRSLLLVKQGFDALREQSEQMRRMAFSDSLTGNRNKRYLLDFGDELIGKSANKPVAVMINDIDHFKHINDNFGHLTGDKVLQALGGLLNKLFPENQGNLVCRFGGEEFVTMLFNTTTEQALEKAELLRKAVSDLDPAGVHFTTSLGVVGTDLFPKLDLSKLIAKADEALYAAKENGRDRVYRVTSDGLELASKAEA